MKMNGVLLTLLTVISLLLSLSQNLQANETQNKPKLLNPKSETCGEFVGLVEQSETQQSNPKSEVRNPKLDKKEFAQKTMKLHIPFIANNGQVDERIKFYAKTFGGTVFVTKEGEIVYTLPGSSKGQDAGVRDRESVVGEVSYGPRLTENGIRSNPNVLDFFLISYGELLSQIRNPKHVVSGVEPSKICGKQSRTIQNDAICHPECNEGSLVMRRDSSPLAQHDREEPEFHNPLSYFSGVSIRETLIGAVSPLKRGGKGVCNKTPNRKDRNETHPQPLLIEGSSGVAPKEDVSPRHLRERDRVMSICLKEELVGANIKAIQGEQPSVTKVSYFKGNDPSKWKSGISTYEVVDMGEVYDGIGLRLKAYGNNVEKLFTVKPGADPEQIKIRLSGVKECGVRNAEITYPLVPSREGINPKSKITDKQHWRACGGDGTGHGKIHQTRCLSGD